MSRAGWRHQRRNDSTSWRHPDLPGWIIVPFWTDGYVDAKGDWHKSPERQRGYEIGRVSEDGTVTIELGAYRRLGEAMDVLVEEASR